MKKDPSKKVGLLFGYNISDGMSLMKTALLAWRKRLWNRKFSSIPRILYFRNPGNRYPKTNPIMEIGCRCCYWHLNFFHAFTALIDQAGIKTGVQISRGQHRAVAQPMLYLDQQCMGGNQNTGTTMTERMNIYTLCFAPFWYFIYAFLQCSRISIGSIFWWKC